MQVTVDWRQEVDIVPLLGTDPRNKYNIIFRLIILSVLETSQI